MWGGGGGSSFLTACWVLVFALFDGGSGFVWIGWMQIDGLLLVWH